MHARALLFVTLGLGLLQGCGDPPQGAAAHAGEDDLGSQGAPASLDLARDWTFSEVAQASGVDFRATFGDDEFSFILEDSGAGLAVLDFDGDGWLDLYLVSGSWLDGVSDPEARKAHTGRVNHLYRNRRDGTFEDVTETAGVGDGGYGMGVVVGDYDGDGDEDLYVLNYGPNVLYQNQGDGTFLDVTEAAALAGPATLNDQVKWSVNGFFFDPDADGDLDLYVAHYLAFDPEFVDPNLPEEYPYSGPESYAGQASLLYRNNGDGTFSEETQAAGLWKPDGKTMGAAASDLDGDGDLDVFEAVDFTGNLVFRNDDGQFVEVSKESGVAMNTAGEPMASMHASIADYDGDGDFDVFVPDLAHGCLYRNDGAWNFTEASAASGIADSLRAQNHSHGGWGSSFADFDNDGDLDLMVVLGGAFDLAGGQTSRLFLNDGEGKFTDVSAQVGGYFKMVSVSRGAAFGDLDNDGDVDFVVSRKDVDGAFHVVRNELPNGLHWLSLKLIGTESNIEGLGARVELAVGEKTQVREVSRAGSYLSSSDVRVHFGLGESPRADSIKIVWPSGRTQMLTDVAADQILEVREPGS